MDSLLILSLGVTGMDFISVFMGVAKLYGVPYGLFIALLVYVLWANNKRESRYLDVIKTLGEDVKERLTKIEVRLFK